jgi:hypothetical protein
VIPRNRGAHDNLPRKIPSTGEIARGFSVPQTCQSSARASDSEADPTASLEDEGVISF